MTEGLFPPEDTPDGAAFYLRDPTHKQPLLGSWHRSTNPFWIVSGRVLDPATMRGLKRTIICRIPEPGELQAMTTPPTPPPAAPEPEGSNLTAKIEAAIAESLDEDASTSDICRATRAVLDVLAGEWPAALWPAATAAMKHDRDRALATAKEAARTRQRHAARAVDWQLSFAALELAHQDRVTELHRVIDREVARRRQAEADRDELQNVLSDWRHAFAVVAAQPRKAMHQRRSTAERFWTMRRALLECRRVFLLYADMHRAKGTPEADEKADRNAALAEMCKGALRGEQA